MFTPGQHALHKVQELTHRKLLFCHVTTIAQPHHHASLLAHLLHPVCSFTYSPDCAQGHSRVHMDKLACLSMEIHVDGYLRIE